MSPGAVITTTNIRVNGLRAQWLDRHTIAIPGGDTQASWTHRLLCETAGLDLSAAALTPGQSEKYPQLARYSIFHLPEGTEIETLKTALKGEVTVAAFDGASMKYVTGVQIAGVLDDLFYFGGKLGPQFTDDQYDNICIGVWAPTAQSVKLLLFSNENDTDAADTVPMIEANGVWSAEVENSWLNRYYLFSVKVYVPSLQQTIENIVTDPYSTDIALNGIKSRLTDLSESHTKPEGWDGHRSPALRSLNELSIWELHVREFSANDETVAAEHRGTYLAFAAEASNGIKHLRRLADAGLKAVHLLPTFHIASINEDKSAWKEPGDLSGFPPDGTQQQEAVAAVRDLDGYNWGYDPVHYMAPEGGYAANPTERVKEYRAMVQGLHKIGLRVIQDVVFNHTSSNGQDRDSVLDKIVPGYYHRLDADGKVLKSSCCSDTASEHGMMEKLMVDCLVQNARQYKIDGFRFDLMSFHFVYNLENIRAALAKLTVENDGVDGSKIYLYGEGWTTGETANNALGPNASQVNLHGTGVGTFNDRIRDAIRGGNPFADQRMQGFATGLYTDSSAYTQQNESRGDQLNQLLDASDWIRAALAGNMRDFSFLDSRTQITTAGALNYEGQSVGYTASPIECVNYCSVHDNQNLFDAIQIKAPWQDNTAVRARRQVLALSLIALGQGIPFFYSGDEMLRSKDMDNNSYNSGDWFNKLDFTHQSNNWGVGLPMASENQGNWYLMQPLLANPALRPTPADIAFTLDAFEALLKIRYSSALFCMVTLAEVQRNLSFLRTDAGIIAMRLNANAGKYAGYQQVLVIFNATSNNITLQDAALTGLPLVLHPALKDGGEFDSVAGSAKVSALTTAVFVAN